MENSEYRQIKMACRLAMATSAIVNNFPPLLFTIFQKEFGLSLGSISALIAINFLAQIVGAIASPALIKRLGQHSTIIIGHGLCGAGLIILARYTTVEPSPFLDIAITLAVSAFGSGIINVTINPIIESICQGQSGRERSSIYAFYCWGFVLVVLITTLALSLLGQSFWRAITIAWALVPFITGAIFGNSRHPKETFTAPVFKLINNKTIIIFLILMFCAGAAEQSMAQWASLFAKNGLGLSKTTGDLAGPCVFAAAMGLARWLYPKIIPESRLAKFMLISALACASGYAIVALAPIAALAFIGCGLIGLSVGILWPGTLSLSAERFSGGKESMFAALVVFGNLGCAVGPALVGATANLTESLHTGILFGLIFPIAFGVFLLFNKKAKY